MKPLFLGKSESAKLLDLSTGFSRGTEKVFLTADDLKTHVHGIGAPRSGKSKMIEWIARQLIMDGEGFCLIDPHGTLYDELVMWLAYLKPKREVILFNPSGQQRVVGFNPFRMQGGDITAYVERMAKAIIRVWGAEDIKQTPRLARLLKSVLYTIIEQGRSIDTARYLLSFKEKIVRSHLVGQIKSHGVRNDFEELGTFNRAVDFLGQVESVKNRLFDFLESQQVRRIVNLDHHNLDLKDIIEGKKILLCNLHDTSDTLSSESASLLGTLLLNDIWTVAKQRKGKHGNKPHDFFVIMDEFQNFITPDIPEILPQSPKFGLKFMLFHQYLGQLQEREGSEVYDAVMNTCQTKLVFGGLTQPDAETMVKEIFPGQINLKRVKFLNHEVRFWPRVGRAEVTSESDTEGESHGSSSGSSFGLNVGSGNSYGPGLDDWVISDNTTTIDIGTSGSSDGTSSSRTVSTSDVPFIYPEPYTHEGIPETYSMEEMVWQLASLLREQYQRRYFIRRPGQPTVAAVTPHVPAYFATEERVARYVEQALKEFLTPKQIDDELEGMHQKLVVAAGSKEQTEFNPGDEWEKP